MKTLAFLLVAAGVMRLYHAMSIRGEDPVFLPRIDNVTLPTTGRHIQLVPPEPTPEPEPEPTPQSLAADTVDEDHPEMLPENVVRAQAALDPLVRKFVLSRFLRRLCFRA